MSKIRTDNDNILKKGSRQRMDENQQQIKLDNIKRLEKRDMATKSRKYLNSLTTGKYSWLITQLKEVCATDEEDLAMCSFRFKKSKEAANCTAEVIASYDNDFSKAIENYKNTIVTPGSEFRPIYKIKKIWKH